MAAAGDTVIAQLASPFGREHRAVEVLALVETLLLPAARDYLEPPNGEVEGDRRLAHSIHSFHDGDR